MSARFVEDGGYTRATQTFAGIPATSWVAGIVLTGQYHPEPVGTIDILAKPGHRHGARCIRRSFFGKNFKPELKNGMGIDDVLKRSLPSMQIEIEFPPEGHGALAVGSLQQNALRT
ncbi:unnamed protein product [Effrenium voratum]|uniref:Uncharacterized protein n=1 Tax=Effrenium voratum TaxID=2562239 RepID=A0AA36NA68_9DINO|nr:unnamed protein product [Effrenium voratum]CAJ1399772.1 unnamed protein product [Effrenium voratum]